MVERCPDKTEVDGSIPSARTEESQILYGARKKEVEGSIPSTRIKEIML